MKRYYAGIGSRDTPAEICKEMEIIAAELERRGYTLRSGNAKGADQAFASGVIINAQIWLPWTNFQKEFRLNKSAHTYIVWEPATDAAAVDSIAKYHPTGASLPRTSKLFMGRNYRQVIGKDEANSEFIICWTPDGKLAGGTAQAIRIAKDFGIPIINMFNFCTARQVIDALEIWHNLRIL